MDFMKKVRFETPVKRLPNIMNDSECHSPRPLIEQELHTSPPMLIDDYPRVVTYSTDPLVRYENSNSSPYTLVTKTRVPSFSDKELCWKPSDDLNLSLLDASTHEPHQPAFCKSILKDANQINFKDVNGISEPIYKPNPYVVSSGKKETIQPPNVLLKDNSFFLRHDNLDKYHLNIHPIQTQLSRLCLDKENNPLTRKAEMIQAATLNVPQVQNTPLCSKQNPLYTIVNDICKCHRCINTIQNNNLQPTIQKEKQIHYHEVQENFEVSCICSTPRSKNCIYLNHSNFQKPPINIPQNVCDACSCHVTNPSIRSQNAVDQKTWAIEKYEQNQQPDSLEVEKQTNVSKDKREPTVKDLFKIIKLQSEQLQLLQEKVDKFILSNRQTQPMMTCSTEHVAVNTIENDQHKMSVGVMTSFEMIRTSTVINKEILQQTNENAQIQCNRSQISVKEVVSKPVNMNFLDGIAPKNDLPNHIQSSPNNALVSSDGKQTEHICEEKTLNDLSLYNVQVDNATTPQISPEQTMYLDVRDYSDSEASNNDQSNVGWTYYNKVMTHVNGILHDSEMPSSASAMYRNMRQQCLQMQIDKTNVSVTKRVKFGDDSHGLQQRHIYAPSTTDTSLKMNQLAAKYLKNIPAQVVQRPKANPSMAPIDMSFATRNYMEKHRILQGSAAPYKPSQADEIPRFLDITALKQQPKFL